MPICVPVSVWQAEKKKKRECWCRTEIDPVWLTVRSNRSDLTGSDLRTWWLFFSHLITKNRFLWSFQSWLNMWRTIFMAEISSKQYCSCCEKFLHLYKYSIIMVSEISFWVYVFKKKLYLNSVYLHYLVPENPYCLH